MDESAGIASSIPPPRKALRMIRETLAISLWSFLLVKLFVFDLDVYFFDVFTPKLRWLLNYKAFGMMAILIILLLASRRNALKRSAWLIAGYPLVLLFRAIRLSIRNRMMSFIILPIVVDFFRSFTKRVVAVFLVSLAMVLILCSVNIVVGIPCVGIVAYYWSLNLWRQMRRAFTGESVYAALAQKLRKHWKPDIFVETMSKQATPEQRRKTEIHHIAFTNFFRKSILSSIEGVRNAHLSEISSGVSFLLTLGVTFGAFGLFYFAINTWFPGSFIGGQPISVFDCFFLSFRTLIPSPGIPISAVGSLANSVVSLEALMFWILVLIVCSLMWPIRREKINEDLNCLTVFLQEIEESINMVASERLQMSLLEVDTAFELDKPAFLAVWSKIKGV